MHMQKSLKHELKTKKNKQIQNIIKYHSMKYSVYKYTHTHRSSYSRRKRLTVTHSHTHTHTHSLYQSIVVVLLYMNIKSMCCDWQDHFVHLHAVMCVCIYLYTLYFMLWYLIIFWICLFFLVFNSCLSDFCMCMCVLQ